MCYQYAGSIITLLLVVVDDGTIKNLAPFECRMLESIDLDNVETDTIALKYAKCFFGGNDNGEICMFNSRNISKFKAHNAGIKKLCCSEDFTKLISLGYDGYLIIWEVLNNELNLIKKFQYPYRIWVRSLSLFK